MFLHRMYRSSHSTVHIPPHLHALDIVSFHADLLYRKPGSYCSSLYFLRCRRLSVPLDLYFVSTPDRYGATLQCYACFIHFLINNHMHLLETSSFALSCDSSMIISVHPQYLQTPSYSLNACIFQNPFCILLPIVDVPTVIHAQCVFITTVLI